ncbi:uncharacterized protein F4822DRAFT_435117 [Hypoxylon trugodes]|uniref:uncharacterized protein n=1 Tax=Hypoxylon trugodes TaxID=326681 RepID=UPI00218CBFBE|nr:uncharacterized protein F4822DRAFT_435117 [Hypoxylon trugodes]KAI1382739.1 hypothetical protein F4822DRAFT_435117 [Hypoxylon trugodes]
MEQPPTISRPADSKKALTEFTPFPRLPPMIRQMIWELASPEIIRIRIRTLSPKLKIRMPTCFHARREAREQIMKNSVFFLVFHRTKNIHAEKVLSQHYALRGILEHIQYVMLYRCLASRNDPAPIDT